jgi:hypothetical protein
VDWIHLAQDSDQVQFLIRTKIKLLASYKAADLF